MSPARAVERRASALAHASVVPACPTLFFSSAPVLCLTLRVGQILAAHTLRLARSFTLAPLDLWVKLREEPVKLFFDLLVRIPKCQSVFVARALVGNRLLGLVAQFLQAIAYSGCVAIRVALAVGLVRPRVGFNLFPNAFAVLRVRTAE